MEWWSGDGRKSADHGVQGEADASLAGVCYKPFGETCATQSLLQYWQMNRTIYEQGFPPHHTKLSPEFCFGHWSTQVGYATLHRTLHERPDSRLAVGGHWTVAQTCPPVFIAGQMCLCRDCALSRLLCLMSRCAVMDMQQLRAHGD